MFLTSPIDRTVPIDNGSNLVFFRTSKSKQFEWEKERERFSLVIEEWETGPTCIALSLSAYGSIQQEW